jgi:hypothetical protein
MFRIGSVLTGALSVAVLGALLHAPGNAVGEDAYAKAAAPRASVLVELFTSEGCSDCPPADALLEKLDKSQPVRGADLIVLSEHVDYWNSLGWRDPYSAHEYSERQTAFARRFSLRSVYTPQMVVDGSIQFVGSDERGAIRAIESAAQVKKAPMSLSSIRFEAPDKVVVHIEAGAMPSALAEGPANVFLAAADDSDESHVSRGENAGRALRHVAVVRTLALVGAADQSAGFSKDVKIRVNSANLRATRLVAFVQDEATGRIVGVGMARASN